MSIGYDTVMDALDIRLVYYTKDAVGTYREYSDNHFTWSMPWYIHRPYFQGEETQPQHTWAKSSQHVRFFNPYNKCTVWRCLTKCGICTNFRSEALK